MITIEPRGDPLRFAEDEKGSFAKALDQHGAILFRGFGTDTPEAFDAFCRVLSPNRPDFKEESSPRSRVVGAVYTSTDYPAEYPIQFHNEYSYSLEWPMRLYFGCLVAPKDRGATPIADTRRILERLQPTTRAAFEKRRVLYVRNFAAHVGVGWQTAFGTSDASVVEAYCRSANIEARWGEDDRLTTRQIGDAIVSHPRTSERIWFNHAFFFNVRGLEPEAIREAMLEEPEDELSTNTYYGDGAAIEPDVIEEIRAAYEQERVSFRWQQGDVLLIDNMLMSHSREPFSGPRKILVTMGDPFKRADLRG